MKNPELTPQQVGDLRLLELASILDHAEQYHQAVFEFACGSPACALGHWAHAHPERWVFELGTPRLRAYPYRPAISCAAREFHMSENEACNLFAGRGCNWAGTDAKKAAAFIRAFVEARNEKP